MSLEHTKLHMNNLQSTFPSYLYWKYSIKNTYQERKKNELNNIVFSPKASLLKYERVILSVAIVSSSTWLAFD